MKTIDHNSVEAATRFLANLRRRASSSPAAKGRLIFALDATGSREATWDQACHIQGEMFDAAAGLGSLETKLMFYRGAECKASGWVSSADDLRRTTLSQTPGAITGSERIEIPISATGAGVAREARDQPPA